MLIPNFFAAAAILSNLAAAVPLPANDAVPFPLSERTAPPTIATEVVHEALHLSKRIRNSNSLLNKGFRFPWQKPKPETPWPRPNKKVLTILPRPYVGKPLPLYARPPNPGNPKYFPEKKKYAPGEALGIPANAPALGVPVKAAPLTKRTGAVDEDNTETLFARTVNLLGAVLKKGSCSKAPKSPKSPKCPVPVSEPRTHPYRGYIQLKNKGPNRQWNSEGAMGKRAVVDEDNTGTLFRRGLEKVAAALQQVASKPTKVPKVPKHLLKNKPKQHPKPQPEPQLPIYRGYIQHKVSGSNRPWNSAGVNGKRAVVDQDSSTVFE
ncbi:hypothetical protein HYFRA_00013869 [Hymenoscyphus fraxineus]|uniref:Uncharacterized protein n=1 Tax=Hymenoscyphus fraxineus TaxID=746836 RepID=A0A9N9LBG6_9HELO|nr:hypothetical protein HYFRA_00013869 [Hymenoscyphus fraxineus]